MECHTVGNNKIRQTERGIKMLETGIKAPSFELPDQNGVIHTLDEYRGKKVILYFIQKTRHRAAPVRHADLRSFIPSF